MTFPSEPDLRTTEGIVEEFAAIVYEATHENLAPNWTLDLISAGLDPPGLREMATRWRDWEFPPPGVRRPRRAARGRRGRRALMDHEPRIWVVGDAETTERLGIFSSHEQAADWIGTLPGHEDGHYYLDGPCYDVILRDPSAED